jgi:DNA processing protein
MISVLSDNEKLARLRLIRTENVGPITYNRLIDRFGTAEKALAALPDLAKRGGKSEGLKAYAAEAAKKEIDAIEKFGARLIIRGTAEYPQLLAEIDDAPPVLTVLGNTQMLSKVSLGVVGARNASLSGRKIAESFSAKIGQAGYVIVSGLARGIDSAAHAASLATGTVAVVAGGIDIVYPPENKNLYAQIAERGAIVAESPFGTEPIARHFPRRNRIISGLCRGVLVVEARPRPRRSTSIWARLRGHRQSSAMCATCRRRTARSPRRRLRHDWESDGRSPSASPRSPRRS